MFSNFKFLTTPIEFKIIKKDTDPNLKIESIDLKLDDNNIKIENVDNYTIGDLIKDTVYYISYTYTLVNINTNLKPSEKIYKFSVEYKSNYEIKNDNVYLNKQNHMLALTYNPFLRKLARLV